MKGGITRRLDDVLKSLDAKQLKKALYLTESNEKLSQQHQYIQEAASTCLANKGNKEVCQAAIKEARNKVQDTVSLPIDDTSLEGLEEYMTEQKLPEEIKPVEAPAPVETLAPAEAPLVENPAKAEKSPDEMSDEEVYESCEDCHVAWATARFIDVCAENREESGGCEVIGRLMEKEYTEPVDWNKDLIKAMVETAEKAQGKAKNEMVGAIAELGDYLTRRNSPFLKALDKDEDDAKVS